MSQASEVVVDRWYDSHADQILRSSFLLWSSGIPADLPVGLCSSFNCLVYLLFQSKKGVINECVEEPEPHLQRGNTEWGLGCIPDLAVCRF